MCFPVFTEKKTLSNAATSKNQIIIPKNIYNSSSFISHHHHYHYHLSNFSCHNSLSICIRTVTSRCRHHSYASLSGAKAAHYLHLNGHSNFHLILCYHWKNIEMFSTKFHPLLFIFSVNLHFLHCTFLGLLSRLAVVVAKNTTITKQFAKKLNKHFATRILGTHWKRSSGAGSMRCAQRRHNNGARIFCTCHVAHYSRLPPLLLLPPPIVASRC